MRANQFNPPQEISLLKGQVEKVDLMRSGADSPKNSHTVKSIFSGSRRTKTLAKNVQQEMDIEHRIIHITKSFCIYQSPSWKEDAQDMPPIKEMVDKTWRQMCDVE